MYLCFVRSKFDSFDGYRFEQMPVEQFLLPIVMDLFKLFFSKLYNFRLKSAFVYLFSSKIVIFIDIWILIARTKIVMCHCHSYDQQKRRHRLSPRISSYKIIDLKLIQFICNLILFVNKCINDYVKIIVTKCAMGFHSTAEL